MSVWLGLEARLSGGVLGLLGRTPSTEEIIKKMEAWILQYCSDLAVIAAIGARNDHPTLFCKLHPAAEDLEIAFENSKHFTVSANTSSAGPGYHIFVCDMLHALGKHFKAVWQEPTEEYLDEAEYFHSGDREAVFKHMTAWIGGLTSLFFNGTLSQEKTQLAMSADESFEWKAPAITPLGPRDLTWLRRTSENGYAGRDFFAWWNPELNADYFLGRALVRMWADVRWRKPINDQERAVLKYVADSLDVAYKLNPDLDYPWAEWAEILGFLNKGTAEHNHVRERALRLQPSIGYRRLNVTVQLPGNWWITVPGSFSDFEPDEDHNFFALDPPREVWVTSYTFSRDPWKLLESERVKVAQENPELIHEEGEYISSAKITHKVADDHKFFQLSAVGVCVGGQAVCTIVFVDPADRDWAITVWKSLKAPKPKTQ